MQRTVFGFGVCLVLVGLLGGIAACRTAQPTPPPTTAVTPTPPTYLLGGSTTRIQTPSPQIFAMPALGLIDYQQLKFQRGQQLFNTTWQVKPTQDNPRAGLGPLYNAAACSDCHRNDGRGELTSAEHGTRGLLLRVSRAEQDLHYQLLPDAFYGDQLQDDAIDGLSPEGQLHVQYTEQPGVLPDGETYSLRVPKYSIVGTQTTENLLLSPRFAPQMIGMGLLEAVPPAVILAAADPNDLNQDGISGRPNWVWDFYEQRTALGRFGWKANQPSVLQQVAMAFNADMGITNDLFPNPNCTAVQTDCLAALAMPSIELSADDLLSVVLYSATLAVPVQRDYQSPEVQQGAALFTQIGCSSCHTPTLHTGIHPVVAALSQQQIHPYTDLLLHDMGNGLADDRPDFQANGTEWRTPPLWGIGLLPVVNEQPFYLHDGRARSLLEAILWHGGEARGVTESFQQLTRAEREALLAFLRSL